jgi:hypothetical protein
MLPADYRCAGCLYFDAPNPAAALPGFLKGAADYPRRGLCQRYPATLAKLPTEGCGEFSPNPPAEGDTVENIGTRTRQNQVLSSTPSRGETALHSADVGMTKNATASCTFVAGGTNQVQAANGTFSAFVVNDLVLIEKTNLNNGAFVVTAIDVSNGSFLTLTPHPKAEGPLSATIRTA